MEQASRWDRGAVSFDISREVAAARLVDSPARVAVRATRTPIIGDRDRVPLERVPSYPTLLHLDWLTVVQPPRPIPPRLRWLPRPDRSTPSISSLKGVKRSRMVTREARSMLRFRMFGRKEWVGETETRVLTLNLARSCRIDVRFVVWTGWKELVGERSWRMLCFGDFWRWNISMNCLYVVKINIRNEEENRLGRNILVFLISFREKKEDYLFCGYRWSFYVENNCNFSI